MGGGSAIENGAGAVDMFSAIYDGRGTCRMGTSITDSVVDAELRVHGIHGLRIVDGSVIPHASPYLALPEVLAMGEKAAAMILEEDTEERANAATVPVTEEIVEHVTIPELIDALGPQPTLVQVVEYLAGDVAGGGEEQFWLQSEHVILILVAGFVLCAAIYNRTPPIDRQAGNTDAKVDAISDP